MISLACVYLVIGSGATGMSFVDELILGNTNKFQVIVVDRRSKPGGHWIDSYDFVRLHQPSAWYGVNSRDLGTGFAYLVSKAQILAYYELIMADLLATGRVKYFPLCEYQKDGKFVSLVQEGLEYQVEVRKKTVDATLMETKVPSTRTPDYEVNDDVSLIPINGLSQISRPWNKYVVIGAGKTGLDALNFLLDLNVQADKIQWIVSNDCWYINRAFFIGEDAIPSLFETLFNSILNAENLDDIYKNGEKSELMLRLDKNIEPTKFRGATVSRAEFDKLKTIEDIVRNGRISKITKDKLLFSNGKETPVVPDSLFIDCTAPGFQFQSTDSIFPDQHQIRLQMVKIGQATFSGAIIAALELNYTDDLEKLNDVCRPIAAPQELVDWLSAYKIHFLNTSNMTKIIQTLGLTWFISSRLCAGRMVGIWGFIKIILATIKSQKAVIKKLEEISEKTNIYN